jgi:hypothetical protein
MSEQTGHQPTLIPAQPAVLVVGDRRISIDEWPLAQSVEERRSVEVNRPSDDVLVIGDLIENLVLLHANCHRQVHSEGLVVGKPAYREVRS